METITKRQLRTGDFVVINKKTKEIISRHANSREAWTGWQNAYFALDTVERDNIASGLIKNMEKYLIIEK